MFYHLMNTTIPITFALVCVGIAFVTSRELEEELMLAYENKLG